MTLKTLIKDSDSRAFLKKVVNKLEQIIAPAKKIAGKMSLPGDKSISHRALMLGAIAEGVTEIENLSNGADVASTANCLRSLGVKIKKKGGRTLVTGKGLHGLRESRRALDAGNSGTTMRLLAGILAGQPFQSVLTGDESLRRRPMSRIITPLQQMGARIEAVDGEHAPLSIHGSRLLPISYNLPVASAQLKSCILLAGLYAAGRTEVREPRASRDHTERMLQNFGAVIEAQDLRITVTGPATLTAQKIWVPGDLSSAAFFLAAAVLVPESQLLLERVGINPTRSALLTVLNDMGAKVQILNVFAAGNELIADLYVEHSKLKGIRIEPALIPQIIDEIPILAVLASQATGVTEIWGAGELRKKESDRLQTIATNLSKMGARVEEKEDGLVIEGPTKLRGAVLDSFADHRIAMSFAVAALVATNECKIVNADCANVSFPGFYDRLKQIAVL
ncbi:MAG: 3-phosphoshikimate 1-carboxyvinyltransferase [bacterium]